MRWRALIIVTTAGLYASLLLGSPPPSPTRTPTPTRTPRTQTPTPTPTYAGPTLDITFSGTVLFRKLTPGPGYRVIVPSLRAHKHHPYILYEVNDASEVTFDVSEPFKCDYLWFRWAPLTAELLTLEPANAIVGEPFDATRIKDWLPHLSELVGPDNDFNDDDYNQKDPIVGKVAGQIDIETGALVPLILGTPFHPVKWAFGFGGQSMPQPKVICGTSGIRWLIRLTPNTGKIKLQSASKKKPYLELKVPDGQTTTVTIGNSLERDIECPVVTPMPSDPHFALHYTMLRKTTVTPWIPYRTPEARCTPPAGPGKSRRGSDCLGSQWP